MPSKRSSQCGWANAAKSKKRIAQLVLHALEMYSRNFLPNVHRLLSILATLPVSTSTTVRTFSTLRRLKSYLIIWTKTDWQDYHCSASIKKLKWPHPGTSPHRLLQGPRATAYAVIPKAPINVPAEQALSTTSEEVMNTSSTTTASQMEKERYSSLERTKKEAHITGSRKGSVT